MIELKPCPFCGNDPRMRDYKDVEFLLTNNDCFMVQCNSCGCGTSYEPTESNAAETWNTRYERTCTMEYLGRENGMESQGRYECSECGKRDSLYDPKHHPDKPFTRIGHEYPYTYCPECGAKVVPNER